MKVKANHRCIICGKDYYHCNDCNAMKSFTPWRKVACSTECYQTYLAFLEYRDVDQDAQKFAKQIDYIGMDAKLMPEELCKAYELGKATVIEEVAKPSKKVSKK